MEGGGVVERSVCTSFADVSVKMDTFDMSNQ